MLALFDTAWIWHGGYNKIPHLEDIQDLMHCQHVIVMEKIHGLCWLVGRRPRDNSLIYADRWQVQNKESPLAHIVHWFEGQTKWLQSISDMAGELNAPLVITGEVFGDKIFGEEAVDSYGTIIPYLDYDCDIDFRVHDIRCGGSLLRWDEVEVLAEKMELPLAPVFYKGTPSLSTFDMLLGKTLLVRNGQRGEGLIIRCDPPERDSQGRILIGKIKVGEYSEINSQLRFPFVVPVEAEPAEQLAIEYATEQRVAKGVARLIASGVYTGTRDDIFPLTDWTLRDIQDEAPQAWKNTLAVDLRGEDGVREQIQRMVKYWVEQALRRKLLE